MLDTIIFLLVPQCFFPKSSSPWLIIYLIVWERSNLLLNGIPVYLISILSPIYCPCISCIQNHIKIHGWYIEKSNTTAWSLFTNGQDEILLCSGVKYVLTLSQTSPGFYCLQYKPFENTEGKGEIARNEQFLLFPQCFLVIWKTFCHFHQLWNCLQTLSI